jgi:hypothetical protein
MKTNYIQIVVVAFAPLALRFVLYYAAFRIRSISIRVSSCAIIAGGAYLLAMIPIPLPREIHFFAVVAIAIFLTTRYTEAELFPDALLIPFVVEFASLLLLDHVIAPIFA